MMKSLQVFMILLCMGYGCKHKNETICIAGSFQVEPFAQTTTKYQCNGNNEYTYILRKISEIDSLEPNCFSVGPIPFPVNDDDFVYIILGRATYHYNDTIGFTHLTKDTCNKRLTYEVNMIQRDTALWSNGGGILPVFCSVENIPADYQVEVKYKYVPLP